MDSVDETVGSEVDSANEEVNYNRLGWTHIEWKGHREDILLLGKVEARKQPPKRN